MILKSVHFFGTSVISKIIQNQTGPFSHSAVYVDNIARGYIRSKIDEGIAKRIGLNTICLMEQWPHGGMIKSWMNYNTMEDHTVGTPYEIWGLEVTQAEWEYCMDHYIQSCADKKEYDWGAIVNFRYKFIKEDPNKTICSEEIITPLAAVKNWTTIRPWTIHPSALVNALQIAGGKLELAGIV